MVVAAVVPAPMAAAVVAPAVVAAAGVPAAIVAAAAAVVAATATTVAAASSGVAGRLPALGRVAKNTTAVAMNRKSRIASERLKPVGLYGPAIRAE